MVYRSNIATESSSLETLSSFDLSRNDTPFFGANGALWKLTSRQDGNLDAIKIKSFNDPAPENRSLGRIYGLSDFTTMRTSTGTINLFVNGGRELWSTDGTEAGTIKFQNFNIAFYALGFKEVPSLHVLGKRDGFLYLEGDADPTRGGVQALWKTDGTVTGTVKVQDLFEWRSNAFSPFASATYLLQDRVILTRDSAGLGERSTIDLATGEKKAIDFSSKVGGPYRFQYENNHLYLWSTGTSGEATLWITDGTIERTTILERFQNPALLHRGELGSLYYAAETADGRRGLWSISGSTVEFLFSLGDDYYSNDSSSPISNILFRDEPNGKTLISVMPLRQSLSPVRFESNGTLAGTRQLAEEDIENILPRKPGAIILDGFTYYLEGGRLRRENLATRVAETISSTDVSLSGILQLVNGRLVMEGKSAIYGNELWQSDGTIAGTRMIRDLNDTPVKVTLTTSYTYPQLTAEWDVFLGQVVRNRVTGEVAQTYAGWGGLGFRNISTVADLNWQIVGLDNFDRKDASRLQYTDLLWQNRQTGEVAIWKLDGNNQVTAISLPTVGLGWAVKGLADFDRDGSVDLFWQNELTGETAFWLLDDGRFKSGQFSTAVEVGWEVQGLADLDNDGDVDMVWRNSRSGKVMTRQLDRLNVVADSLLSPAPDSSWQIRGLADVDADGRYDIFWHRIGTSETGYWTLDQFQFKASGFFERSNLSFLINNPDPVEVVKIGSMEVNRSSNLVIQR
jgi:ELWxxDGT repeat protein